MKTLTSIIVISFCIPFFSCSKNYTDKTQATARDTASLNIKKSNPVLITNSKTDFAFIDAISGETIRYENKYSSPHQMSEAPLITGNQMIIPFGNFIRSVDINTKQTLWQTSISHAAHAIHTTSAMCTDGTHIFITLQQENGTYGNLLYHKIFALNASNGNIEWTREISNINNIPTSGREVTAPCAADGKVFVPLKDTMYAYNASTGEELWRFINASIVEKAYNPTVKNGKVFVTTLKASTPVVASLNAIDVTTGKLLWKIDLSEYGLAEVNAAVAENDALYINVAGGVLCADALTGEIKWVSNLAPVFGGFTPVFVAGNVVVTTASSGTAYLTVYAINSADGKLLWQSSHKPQVSSNIFNRGASVLNNIIYVKSNYGFITAFDLQTGNFLWENYMSSSSGIYAPVIVTNTNTVYTAMSGMY